jgi:hypothetical protein
MKLPILIPIVLFSYVCSFELPKLDVSSAMKSPQSLAPSRPINGMYVCIHAYPCFVEINITDDPFKLDSKNKKKLFSKAAASLLTLSILAQYSSFIVPATAAEEASTQSSVISSEIQLVPLYSKKSAQLQPYVDISRGFKMLR